MRFIFSRLDEKRKLLGNCEKISKKISLKIAKLYYFSIFFQKCSKLCVNFWRVWTKKANCWEILKIFEENSIKNRIFIFIFENLFVKIEPSEMTP